MGLNKQHPDYPDFKRQWDELVQAEFDEVDRIDEEERKKGTKTCQDGPASAVCKQYNIKRSALKKKYAYLYTPNK